MNKTKILLDKFNFYTTSCVLCQNLQNGIPEDSRFNDEVFYEDELLRRLQLLKKPLVHIFAQREIRLTGIGMQMGFTDIAQHPCLGVGSRRIFP